MIGPKSTPEMQPRLEALYQEAAAHDRALPIFKDNEYMLVTDPARPQQVMLVDRIALDTKDDHFGYLYTYSFWPLKELSEKVTEMMLQHKLNLLRTDRMFDFAFNRYASRQDRELENTLDICKHDEAVQKSLAVIERETGVKIDHFLTISGEDQIADFRDYFNEMTKNAELINIMIEGRENAATERPIQQDTILKEKSVEREIAQKAIVKSMLYNYTRN